jgi:hypothetical protein
VAGLTASKTHHHESDAHNVDVGRKDMKSGRRYVVENVGIQKNTLCNSEANVPLSPPTGGKNTVWL